MTISPCSQRPTNCCVVKLRWNAAPALSISERESSPLWLPLNSGKSFCQSQRGAGEPTCCTRLKSIAIGSNKYRPSMLEYLSPLWAAASSAAEPASRVAPPMYESANGQVTVTSQHSALPLPLCHGTSVRPSGHFPISICPKQSHWLLGDRETSRSKAPSNRVVQGMMSSCPVGGFLVDKAVNLTGVNHRAAVTLMQDAQIQPKPQANCNSDCLII